MQTKRGLVVTATELKQNFGKYMACVEQKQDVVITKNGTKVARLAPYVTDSEQYPLVREEALNFIHDKKKVSYDEFMEIYGKSELRLEFINGEIHVLASPSITHQRILGQLYLIFQAYLQGQKCQVFFAPFDVHFWKKGIKDKLNTYRLSGVEEYWIVDPKQNNIIVYSLKNHEIEAYEMYGPGTRAKSSWFQGLEADISTL